MPHPEQRKKSRLVAWIVCAVVLLVILAVIFFGYYRGAGSAVSPKAPLPIDERHGNTAP